MLQRFTFENGYPTLDELMGVAQPAPVQSPVQMMHALDLWAAVRAHEVKSGRAN